VKTFLFLLLLASPSLAAAQPADRGELEAFLDGVLLRELTDYHVPGAVVAVVRDGEVLLAKGYGYADLAAKRPVVADRTVFLVGSVAKPVTATAVLQLVERGKLRLDEDVSRYLKSFQLDGPPVTAAHLLTHTGGFDVTLIGTAAPKALEVQPLGRYLAERMPPRVRPPGLVFAYSNHGYALLGHLVEEVSGRPFARYMDENIFQPLGMRHSGFLPLERLEADLAVGYEGGSRIAPPVYPQIGPAAGLATTAMDMARFLIAHLEGSHILGEATLREMHRQHFTQEPCMPGMTWGFFESFENGRRTLFHGGGIRGFMSGVYLWPEHRTGLFIADNGYDGALVGAVARKFLDHYFPGERPRTRPPAGSVERARQCAGRYRLAGSSRTTLEKAAALREGDFLVRDLGGGALGIWGLRFVEVAPWLFQDAEGEERVAFRRDAQGRVTHLVTEELFVGNQTWESLPWYRSASLHRDLFLLLIALFVAALFVRPAVERQGLFTEVVELPLAVRRTVRLGVLLSGLVLLFLVLFVLGFRQAAQGAGLLYGVPWLVKVALAVPLLAIPVALALAVEVVRAWRSRAGSLRWRVWSAVLAMGGIIFPAFLSFWNLLGFRF
jgi:CubicO group peptidase (beta-lactamase class C family)